MQTDTLSTEIRSFGRKAFFLLNTGIGRNYELKILICWLLAEREKSLSFDLYEYIYIVSAR